MVDFLISIPGPTFLLIFIGLSGTLVLAAWGWAAFFDRSTKYSLPQSIRFDPIVIAVLRGGAKAVVETVVFDLWRRGWVHLYGRGAVVEVCGPLDIDPSEEHADIERTIYQFFQRGGSIRQTRSIKALTHLVEL